MRDEIILKFNVVRKHPNASGVYEIENSIVGKHWVHENEIEEYLEQIDDEANSASRH